MDLSKLSDADLQALKSGDLTKVSDEGLMSLKGEQPSTLSKFSPINIAKGAYQESGIPQLLSGDVAGAARSPLVQFAVGAGKPIIGLAERIAGKTDVLQNFNELTGPLNTGQKIAGVAGNVLSPVGLAAGKALPVAATLPGQMAQGAGLGAFGGFIDPNAQNNYEASKNALYGGLLGGILPAVFRGGADAANWVYNKFNPQEIAKKVISEEVGQGNLNPLLQATQNPSQIIPGGKPTVAQATAGLPEASPISALEQKVAAHSKGPSVEFGKRAVEQQDAVDAAIAARKVASSADYGKAFDPALHKLKPDAELATIAQDPFFQKAVPAAEELAAAKGLTPQDNLTEILHYVKVGLDKRIKGGMGEVPIDNAQRAAMMDVKNNLVQWLAKNNSDYETGRSAYAAASKDIEAFLARQELAKNPLQKTTLGTGVISSEASGQFPHFLSKKITLLNYALRAVGHDLEPKAANALSEILLDPTKFNNQMSNLTAAQRVSVQDALKAANALSLNAASTQ